MAKTLAQLGSIRDQIIDGEELAGDLLFRLMRIAPEAVCARFKLPVEAAGEMQPYELLEAAAPGARLLALRRAAEHGARGRRGAGRVPRGQSGQNYFGAAIAMRETKEAKLARLLEREKALLEAGATVAGIDEVGRGRWPGRWWPPAWP